MINTKRKRYDYVVVREVVPNQQFDRFNAENPSESCEVGDRIVQVTESGREAGLYAQTLRTRVR